MENQGITELLLEVTRIENLVAASGQGDQGSGGALHRITRGFRTLADQPDRFDTNDEDFGRFAAALETELDSVQKASPNPYVAVENLASRIGNAERIGDIEVSDAQREAFLGANDHQMRRFP